MRTVGIVSDSTCDLSVELLEKYQITIFPLHIHLGEEEYSDGVNITPEQIYAWSDANKATPKTSELSPFEAKEYLEKQLAVCKEVICFCVSEEMSSCANVMRMAALAGSTLKLHPYISVADGKMQAGKKYRGKMDKVISDYVQDLKPALKTAHRERVFITHSGCEESIINMVKEQLEEMNYFDEILVTRAGSVITSHCGPGTLGVLFIAGE